MVLQTIWYFLVGVLLLGYALLDGFDLGVGNLHLLTRGPERNQTIQAIGPFWDANQVWLLTGGGAIFAAFPLVYATVFSGFYLAMMLVLLALITRAIALEFRHQIANPAWQSRWDIAFGIANLLASILFGVAMGNILLGIPLDADGVYYHGFFYLLRPYAVLCGLFSLAMFTLHGASYLIFRADVELANKAKRWAKKAHLALAVLFILITALSWLFYPHLYQNFIQMPLWFIWPLLALASLLYYPRALKEQPLKPFLTSAVGILGYLGTVGVALFPHLVYANNQPDLSLTAFNASSSQLTLTVMLIIALIGVPLMLFYTGHVYKNLKVFSNRLTKL